VFLPPRPAGERVPAGRVRGRSQRQQENSPGWLRRQRASGRELPLQWLARVVAVRATTLANQTCPIAQSKPNYSFGFGFQTAWLVTEPALFFGDAHALLG
jgi:hypothetical protein